MENIEKYIDELYNAQNINADSTQRNLCPREFYQNLVFNVLKTINENKDASLSELRTLLYKNSEIEKSLKNFFYERQMAPGAVITYGTENYQETIILGNKKETTNNIEPMEKDTIFDLASTTKGFTAIATLKLLEMGLIDNLEDDVTKYVPQFENLKGITIYDLLTFIPLKTTERIDKATSIDEAENILFKAEPNQIPKTANPYNDIAPMVLKYIIEKTSGMDYYTFLKCTILDTIDMNDTYVKIPEENISRVASGNNDTRYYKDGNIITREYITQGISTDDKARVLGQPNGNLSGHAGLFSTADNMKKLAQALIDNKILNLNLRQEMTKNRIGKMYLKEDGSKGYVQYLGMLHYSKNPNLAASEVHHPLSGEAFAGAGWSGTQLTIDPIHNINFFMGANRSHNRMTIIDPIHQEKIKTDEKGKRTIILPDGRELIDASKFAMTRDDAIVHPCIELALQYKILEDIIGKKEIQKEEQYIYIK